LLLGIIPDGSERASIRAARPSLRASAARVHSAASSGRRLEQIGGEREHAAREGDARAHRAAASTALDPFEAPATPRQARRVRRGFRLRDGALRQCGDELPPRRHAGPVRAIALCECAVANATGSVAA
jgi:hypothetical protein